jgi:hypothetical protein
LPEIPNTVSGTVFAKKLTVSEKRCRKFPTPSAVQFLRKMLTVSEKRCRKAPTPSVVHFSAKNVNRIRKVSPEIPNYTVSGTFFYKKCSACEYIIRERPSRGPGGARGGENNLEFPAGTYQTEIAARRAGI